MYICYTGRPTAPSPINLVARSTPTASNTQFQPRQRLPGAPRMALPQPREQPQLVRSAPTPSNSRTPRVPVRPQTATATPRTPTVTPRTPTGQRLTRPPLPAVVQNVVAASEPPVVPVATPLPVPRITMAPSRIAAIMMRRQYSADRVIGDTHTWC